MKRMGSGNLETIKKDEQVRKMLAAPSLAEHLRYKRLRFFQNLIKFPKKHEQVLSVMFGKYGFENELPASPWLQMVYDDVMQLKTYDGMGDLCKQMGDLFLETGERCLQHLLRDQRSRRIFIDFDLKQYKVATALQDPNHVTVTQRPGHIQRPIDEQYICDHILDTGTICGASFDTCRGLFLHRRHNNIHGSDGICLASMVITNQ